MHCFCEKVRRMLCQASQDVFSHWSFAKRITASMQSANRQTKNTKTNTRTYKCYVKLCKDVFFHSFIIGPGLLQKAKNNHAICKGKQKIQKPNKHKMSEKHELNMCSRSRPRTKCVWFVGQTQTQTQTHRDQNLSI